MASESKSGRKRSGTIHRYVPAKPGERWGHYVVRCSAPDGSRPLFHLDPGPKSPQAEKATNGHAVGVTDQLCGCGPSTGAIRWHSASRLGARRSGTTATYQNSPRSQRTRLGTPRRAPGDSDDLQA